MANSGQVCKYWQQGICKFGKDCRNVHGSADFGFNRNAPPSKKAPTDWKTMSDEEILKGISAEVAIWETSKMWPLSVFSFANGAPILPGLSNYSFEEIRWEAYSANASGTFNQYVPKLAQLLNEAKQQKAVLKNPDPGFRMKLLEFIHNAKIGLTKSVIAANPTTTNQLLAPSGFPQQQQQQQPQMVLQPGAVSQQTNPTPTSLSFGSSFINTAVATPQMGFSNQNLSTNSQVSFIPNSMATPSAPVAVQNATNDITSTSSPANQKTTLLFGKQVVVNPTEVASAQTASEKVHSAITDLTPVELEAFKADNFSSFDNIPIRPPPQELC